MNKQFAGDAAWVQELFDMIEATPQIKALCWFPWGKEWNVEHNPGQLARYHAELRSPIQCSVCSPQSSTRTGGSVTPR